MQCQQWEHQIHLPNWIICFPRQKPIISVLSSLELLCHHPLCPTKRERFGRTSKWRHIISRNLSRVLPTRICGLLASIALPRSNTTICPRTGRAGLKETSLFTGLLLRVRMHSTNDRSAKRNTNSQSCREERG